MHQSKFQNNQNFFTFSFTTLNFINKTKSEYSYILENFYPEWISAKNGSYISFTNVPSGEYNFRVKWTNEDGIWNKDEHSIFIKVKPAWYASIFAFISYFILFISEIYVADRNL